MYNDDIRSIVNSLRIDHNFSINEIHNKIIDKNWISDTITAE